MEQYEYEVIKPENLVKRDITPQKYNQSIGILNQSKNSNSKADDGKIQQWMPTSLRDDSLERSFQKSIERDSPIKQHTA